MKATVKSDRTMRTIELDIERGSVPDHDVTQRWHKNTRTIRPHRVVITSIDDKVNSVQLSGGLVLKSGVASDQATDKAMWYSWDHAQPAMPDWLEILVEAALQGVTSWNTREVQAL